MPTFFYTTQFRVLGIFLLGGLIYLLRVSHIDTPDFKVFYTAGSNAFYHPDLIYNKSPDRFLYLPAASFFLSRLA